MSRIINDFRNSVPRINEEQERANKELILEHLRDTRMEENTRFVVEGATVVCTQMKTAPIPRIQVSESKMKKLEASVRQRRMRATQVLNPNRGTVSGRRTTSVSDRLNAVGNEDANIQDMMSVNGNRLLTNFDIEFEPLFTNATSGVNAQSLVEARNLGRIGRPNNSPLDHLIAEFEGCGGCKSAGDCKPDIEQLMWLDTDEDVSLTGSNTLLMNTAYMFCHHGQGLLYIEESGQYNTELARAARELWSDDEELTVVIIVLGQQIEIPKSLYQRISSLRNTHSVTSQGRMALGELATAIVQVVIINRGRFNAAVNQVANRFGMTHAVTLEFSQQLSAAAQIPRDVTNEVNVALQGTVETARRLRANVEKPINSISASVRLSIATTNLTWFGVQMRINGPWDLKVQSSWENTLGIPAIWGHNWSTLVIFRGMEVSTSHLGNWIYGYVGNALGISLSMLIGASTAVGWIGDGLPFLPNDFIESIRNEMTDWPEVTAGFDAYSGGN